MLYYLLYPLHDDLIIFNVFRYITFRTFGALITAMVIYFLFGKFFINYLRKVQFGVSSVREDVPSTHLIKVGTPTMGGVLIWISIITSILLWSKLDVGYVLVCLALTLAFALIGFIDDYRKVVKRDPKGLRARHKFPLQVLAAAAGMVVLITMLNYDTNLSLPFFKSIMPQIGWWYVLFGVVVIAGTSNAVNLTDGLDGLVTMPAIISFTAFAVLSYIAGNIKIASYLQVPFIAGSGELTVVCGAVVGSLIGFLWYNSHPAEVFMGDVGSLPLGALLGMIAVMVKHEFLLVVIGGIFVLETVSVIVQVASFKLTGKRVFRMAPIHHHFELKGWKESKVITRFWIIAIILALLSLSTLKLR